MWSYRWTNKLLMQERQESLSSIRKRKSYAVSAERWRIVSGAEIEPGESVTIVVEHVH